MFKNQHIQKQFSGNQYSNPHKTYLDKPYKTKTVCFAKYTKSETDRQEMVNEIDNSSTSKTKGKHNSKYSYFSKYTPTGDSDF